jgi:hypothetical protein
MMDIARLGMNINEHPVKIACSGGFYAYAKESDQEVPNLEVATFEYANGAIMELEVRSLPTPMDPFCNLWLGTKGYATLQFPTSQNGFKVFVSSAASRAPIGGFSSTAGFSTGMQQDQDKPTLTLTDKDLEPDSRWDEIIKAGIDPHFQNFVDCVKSRNYKDLAADILEGHISTAMLHIGNTAYRTGRKLLFDGKTEKYVNDKDADAYLSRPGGGRKPFSIPNVV